MASAYAQTSDDFAFDTMVAGLTSASDSTGSTIVGSIGTGITDSWSVMRFSPNRLLVAPSTTGTFGLDDLLTAVDSDGRPIYWAAGQLMNQAGDVSVPNAEGRIMGLDLIVDGNIGSTTNPFLYPSAAVSVYESAGAPVQISVQDVSTLEVEVAVYGYIAVAVKYPTAVRELFVS